MQSVAQKNIDGKLLAKEIEAKVGAAVDRLKTRGVTPRLVSLAVDEEDASFDSYMRQRDKACVRVGIESSVEKVPLAGGERELNRALARLSADSTVHGILIKQPLPSGFNEQALLANLDPKKDVEGIHPYNLGLLALGRPRFVPCTALAVMEIMDRFNVEMDGRHIVVLGRSKVVGAPLTTMLLQKRSGGNGTVTVCHSRTRDLPSYVRQAEILIAAIGQPEFVRGEWLREGAVVIDVGTHAIDAPDTKKGWKLVGDVHAASALPVVSRMTPVPGGVGPVTTSLLLQATARAASGAEE